MVNLGKQPLPADHPLRRGLIIFNPRRLGSSEKPSTPDGETPSSSTRSFEEVASNVYEQALSKLERGTGESKTERPQSSESTTLKPPE